MKLFLKGTGTSNVTGNCGLCSLSNLHVVTDEKSSWGDSMYAKLTYEQIAEWVETDDFSSQFAGLMGGASACVISIRVATIGPGYEALDTERTRTTSLHDGKNGEHREGLFRAISESKKGMFVALPPMSNAAHSGDSIICCGIYVPECRRKLAIMPEGFYHIGEVTQATHQPHKAWHEAATKVAGDLREAFKCLQILEVPKSAPSSITSVDSPEAFNSMESSARSVKVVTPLRKRLASTSKSTKSSTSVTERPARKRVQSSGLGIRQREAGLPPLLRRVKITPTREW